MKITCDSRKIVDQMTFSANEYGGEKDINPIEDSNFMQGLIFAPNAPNNRPASPALQVSLRSMLRSLRLCSPNVWRF